MARGRFETTWNTFENQGGRLSYAEIPWDSELFGFPIFEMRPEESTEDLSALVQGWLSTLPGPQCLAVTKLEPWRTPWAASLCRNGFYPVEMIFRLELGLERFVPVSGGWPAAYTFRPATLDDLPALRAIARQGYTLDRYHLDPHISNDLADQRFVNWIVTALEDNDWVQVAIDKERDVIAGFFHYRDLGDSVADLSSGAFAAEYRRSEIVTLLYEVVVSDCQSRGFRRLETSTPANNAASLNLSFAYGALVRDARMTFHWVPSAMPVAT